MNIETIDKWLNEEYGCSYTRLEELLEFYTDREMKFKERINKAIEYIEEADDNENSYGDYEIHYEVKKELLDILKGDDKE